MNPTSILAGLLVVAFAALGSAKLAAVPAMRAKAEHVGFSVAAYRRIGLSRSSPSSACSSARSSR